MTFAASTRSVWTVDIGVRLLDPAVLGFGFKEARGWDAIDTTVALIYLQDPGLASARDCPFRCMQGAHKSGHVAYIGPMILAGRQRMPGQEVNIGTLAPDSRTRCSGA
jgi:hypothetical protein